MEEAPAPATPAQHHGCPTHVTPACTANPRFEDVTTDTCCCVLPTCTLPNLHPANRLLLNCVGPFRHWGEAVFAACAAAGTDYLDIAGEPGGRMRHVFVCVGGGGHGVALCLLWCWEFRACACQGWQLQLLGRAGLLPAHFALSSWQRGAVAINN